MTYFRSVPSDPRQSVAHYAGTAARRPAAADHDAPIIYYATDDQTLSIGAGGVRTILQDQGTSGAPFVTTTWHLANVVPTNTALVDGTAYAQLVKIPPGAVTITGLAVQVGTLASSSAVRLGVYTCAADFTVGARLLDAGTVASTSTGTKTITSLTLAVPASRRVWLVAAAQGGTPSVYTAANVERVPQSTATNSLTGLSVPTATGVSGAFGTTFTVAAYVAVGPAIAVQLAS